MNDDVAACENSATFVGESQTVAAHIASDCGDSPSSHFGEAVFTKLGAQPIERVVLQDFARNSLFNGGTSTRTNQQHDLAIGHRAQEPLKEIGAEETGGAGDEEPFAGQCLTNHERMFTTW